MYPPCQKTFLVQISVLVCFFKVSIFASTKFNVPNSSQSMENKLSKAKIKVSSMPKDFFGANCCFGLFFQGFWFFDSTKVNAPNSSQSMENRLSKAKIKVSSMSKDFFGINCCFGLFFQGFCFFASSLT
jgi:hypothetical protein